MTEGSSLASDTDPAELVGGFAPKPPTKLRRYSSSTALLLRFRRKKNIPLAIALSATIPTTTPAAIPALLGPFEDGACVVVMIVCCAVVWPAAVTTIVLALVTTDGDPFSVGDAPADDVDVDVDDDDDAALPFDSELEFESELVSELESELELWLATLLLSPVSWTAQEFCPPPVLQSARGRATCLAATYTYPGGIHCTLSCTPNPRL